MVDTYGNWWEVGVYENGLFTPYLVTSDDISFWIVNNQILFADGNRVQGQIVRRGTIRSPQPEVLDAWNLLTTRSPLEPEGLAREAVLREQEQAA